jgi:hypothetical protein
MLSIRILLDPLNTGKLGVKQMIKVFTHGYFHYIRREMAGLRVQRWLKYPSHHHSPISFHLNKCFTMPPTTRSQVDLILSNYWPYEFLSDNGHALDI